MNFSAGDFVQTHKCNPRLIISLDPSYHYLGQKGDVWVIYLDHTVSYIVHGKAAIYVKIQPTQKLLDRAEHNLKAAFDKKEIDNLTYIEICARLKEYEQELRRI